MKPIKSTLALIMLPANNNALFRMIQLRKVHYGMKLHIFLKDQISRNLHYGMKQQHFISMIKDLIQNNGFH